MLDLNNVSTSDLVEALRYRKGVEHRWINVDDFEEIYVEGPSRILVVED